MNDIMIGFLFGFIITIPFTRILGLYISDWLYWRARNKPLTPEQIKRMDESSKSYLDTIERIFNKK